VMDNNDVNDIVESHLKNGQVVDRLVVPANVGR
jgi:(2Fe-2S) ferredoxin